MTHDPQIGPPPPPPPVLPAHPVHSTRPSWGRSAVLLTAAFALAIAGGVGESSTPFSGDVISMIELQRRYARWALDQLGGHKTRTAERL